MSSLTGAALDWAITIAAGAGFLLFGYGASTLSPPQFSTNELFRSGGYERFVDRVCFHEAISRD